jgi:hypothetical protein
MSDDPLAHLFNKASSNEQIFILAKKAFDEIAELYGSHPKNWTPSQQVEIKEIEAIKLDTLADVIEFKNRWINLLETPPF